MVKIDRNKTSAKIIIMVLLCLLTIYPLFMKVNYTSIDFTVHSQIHWFIQLPIAYLITIQVILIIGFLLSRNTIMKILPFVFSYVLVSGFIITQLPSAVQGDNFLHSANAKLINTYGALPPFTDAYSYYSPSSFIFSSILTQLLGIENIYSNALLVALLHITVTVTLYVFLRDILGLGNKELASIICSLNLLGNFQLTYSLSYFTPLIFATPLFYIFLYTAYNQKVNMKIVAALLLVAIITSHPITPLFLIFSVAGLIMYTIFKRVCAKKMANIYVGVGLLILILISWFVWLLYIANYNFEVAVKIAFGQEKSPLHAAYGISSPFVQEQLDFSKDLITSLLRVYRLALLVFTYLLGGVASVLYMLQAIVSKGNNSNSHGILLSSVAFLMFSGSLLSFIIFGRGHTDFLLFGYPIFSALALMMLTKSNSIPGLKKFKVHDYRIPVVILIIMLSLSFISIHSSRIYLGEPDYNGLTFLASFGRDKEISTTGDISYDYAYFNPSYFWPGKTGRTLLIYATPEALIEQSKKVHYIFLGDIAIRSFKQTIDLYFSGLPPDFWKKVDESMAQNRNKIYDNRHMWLWES